VTSLARFWRLLEDIYSVVGGRCVLYLVLLTGSGLVEALSVASVVPLLEAVGMSSGGSAAAGTLGTLTRSILVELGIAPTIPAISVVVLLALALSTTLFLGQAYLGARLQTEYVYRWQQRLTDAVFHARWPYFQQRRQGDLINTIITETQRLSGAFYQAGLLVTGMVHGIIFLSVSAALSGAATALVGAGAAGLFLATRPLIRRAHAIGAGIGRENAELQSLAGELVSGAKLVKATSTEAEAVSLITGAAGRLRHHVLANAFDVQIVKGVFDFGAAALAVGILVSSQLFLSVDAAVTVVVLAIFVRLMPKLTGLQHSFQALALSLPAVEVVHQVASEAEAQREVSASEALPPGLQHGPLSVSLRDVHVHYGSVPALAGVHLEIPAGSCVALVGGSGGGKSSLVDAILGLIPLSRGEIRIGNVPLAGLSLTSVRRRIGYIGQDPVLYNASIRDNIEWGKRHSTDAELRDALRLAGADRFVAALSRGYDTSIGDRGTLLSGGERQRLTVARAALGVPGLLILDEATSALDAETERAVIDAVARLKGVATVVIVAHRLSSVRIADTICVVEGGRIVEQGTWDGLMRREGRLHQLWRLQHADQNVNAEA
jgi:ATP-binding cassette subfamily C protein